MSKYKELLPLGSIVYLEEGTQKLVIVGRGVILFSIQRFGNKMYIVK